MLQGTSGLYWIPETYRAFRFLRLRHPHKRLYTSVNNASYIVYNRQDLPLQV